MSKSSKLSRSVLPSLVLLAACGDADEPSAVDASATQARVAATVRYTGTAQGALVLAAFASMPPMGPPAGFAQHATPTFPATLAIENLAAGPAYVLAVLDVAPASPQQPGPEDRTVWSSQLTLALGETATIELTLGDP
jgi:hypothetical protein